MKLERIQLRGFLSHADTDWSPNGARLVTLVGPNGAGKSALASDAMRYALFDVARGKTDELVKLGASDMSVLVELEYAGARYRIVRGRTTKSGGKSYLELHIADGEGWRPLTGDTIRDTQAAIGELLRLDADTFETAVLLAQGEANRFAEATAGDRKRILGTVLGLDRYARAEARTRELARDAEARIAAERSTVMRLDEQLLHLDDVDEILEQARRVLADTESELAQQGAARIDLEERIRGMDAALATAQTAAATVARLEAERTELGEAWHRANTRKLASQQAITAAEAVVADAAKIDAAAARLPELRIEVERLVALEAEDRRLVAQIRTKRDELAALRKPHDEAVATWIRETTTASAKVADLEAKGMGKAPAICAECGQPIDADNVLEQLTKARKAVKALFDSEPVEPLRFAQDAAAIVRLETRQRELAFEPAQLAGLHREIVEFTAIAARAESIEAARATVTREKAAVIEAAQELARISAKGRQLADALEEAKAVVELAAPLQARRAVAAEELRLVVSAIDQLGLGIREGERAVAAAEADVARRDQLDEERAMRGDGVDALSGELDLLRRLVGAFGVAGIPARIIESVLPELSAYANELLAELRPGMTLELRAQRAAKDGKKLIEALDLVVRDDVGERGLGLFSGGERMSVSLAIAVGLSRLVARRAGTAIRTLVIDEPDGLDADARRAFGQALRVLAHHGELERVVLISHHEDLADVGDAQYRVTKNGSGSVVEQLV